jgi:hypothetical protein
LCYTLGMHKYSLGQTVHYSGEAGSHDVAGEYEIVRLLPETTAGELQYRLKKAPDGQERVVREHLIRHNRADSPA